MRCILNMMNRFQALQDAFDRCVSVIGRSSKPDDLAVQVCLHICMCFATAAQFEACREKISQMPAVFVNICRVLHFNVSFNYLCGFFKCLLLIISALGPIGNRRQRLRRSVCRLYAVADAAVPSWCSLAIAPQPLPLRLHVG